MKKNSVTKAKKAAKIGKNFAKLLIVGTKITALAALLGVGITAIVLKGFVLSLTKSDPDDDDL